MANNSYLSVLFLVVPSRAALAIFRVTCGWPFVIFGIIVNFMAAARKKYCLFKLFTFASHSHLPTAIACDMWCALRTFIGYPNYEQQQQLQH